MLLDEHEKRALAEFLHLLTAERFEPKPQVEEAHILRGPEGQIVVPVVLDAEDLSVSLSLLMAHKAEHLYRQTGCRFVLAQRLKKDERMKYSIWRDGAWKSWH